MNESKQVQKHFATAVYIVDRSQQEPRVLLLKHKKLASWLPPGGHLSDNELPHECALREVEEETGLEVKLVGGNKSEFFDERCWLLPMPKQIQLEEIEVNKHYHIDFVYFAVPDGSAEIKDNEAHGQIKWFTRKEVEAIPPKEIFGNARKIALEALDGTVGLK